MKEVIVPKNATNGDMFLNTFLNSKIESISNTMVTVFVSNMYLSVEFDKDWWNAPYKEESEKEA